MGQVGLDLDDKDDIGYVHLVRGIIDGVLRTVAPSELYLVKIDSWFGQRWLAFSSTFMHELAAWNRDDLRVPPFVPARVISQRFFRQGTGGKFVEEGTRVRLHIEQTSDANYRRVMSVICPNAAVFWWTGDTVRNRRGTLMAYLPTPQGHTGWYAGLENVDGWRMALTVRTSASELKSYADAVNH